MSRLNIEIKASTTILPKLERILIEKNAIYKGEDHQIDTFYNVAYGKLKLREGNIENTLIQYKKENKNGLLESHFQLYKSENLSALKPLLEKALGSFKVVDKKRKIFFIQNAKIHLDHVKHLGQFVEIEILAEHDNIDNRFQSLQEQCRYYQNLFEIKEEQMLTISYVDML